METEDPLADIRQVLIAWSDDAVNQLTVDSWVDLGGPTIWLNWDEEIYITGIGSTWLLLPETQDELATLPSFKALEEAAQKSPLLAPMLGCLVGTPRARGLFSTWNVASAFMPAREDLAVGRAFSFEERYSAVSTLLRTREIEFCTTWPLQGVVFEEEPIELSRGLLIARLTPDEISTTLNARLLQPREDVFLADESLSFALKRTFRLPLVVKPQGHSSSQSDEVSLSTLPAGYSSEEIEQLQQCLALMTHERITVPGSVSGIARPTYLLPATGIQSTLLPTTPTAGTSAKLDSAKCRELRQLWELIHDSSFRQSKGIALALRRLAFGAQRTNIEDRLLDVFIAAEALYLSDSSSARERGELRYRLALRAAVWSEGTLAGWSKRDVFKLMKRGYDARSAVAHGGTPQPKAIVVKGSTVSLAELVKATEDVIRAGLNKALRQEAGTGKQLAIPWDDLVLPDETTGDGTDDGEVKVPGSQD
jgi:hypothetical protein